MTRLLILLPLLLVACNDEQGPKPKLPDGGKPFAVPDSGGWWVITIVLVALVIFAVVEKRLEERE